MIRNDTPDPLRGEIFEEEAELSLAELCRLCRVPAEQVFEWVEIGIITPLGRDPESWRFRGISVRRIRRAVRLQQDLDVNLAGAALAIDLLEELERLRERLRRLGA